jgi:hypothetical protein
MDADVSAQNYQVTLAGPGISIDQTINQERAREILNILMGGGLGSHPNRAGTQAQRAADHQLGTQPALSLREFLDEAEAKSNPEKIVAISQYLIEFEGKSDVGRDDIKACFRTAGEPAPANYPRDFAIAIQNGWIAEDKNNTGRYYVTRRGQDAISQKFSIDVRRSAGRSGGRRRARRLSGSAATVE